MYFLAMETTSASWRQSAPAWLSRRRPQRAAPGGFLPTGQKRNPADFLEVHADRVSHAFLAQAGQTV